jgi:hypothetical protein
MLNCIADFVRTYQTLIAGIVGFSGVIITLLVNAHLVRAQETRKEQRDTDALRKALVEELKVQKDALKRTEESVAELLSQPSGPGSAGLLPIYRFSNVFDISLVKLGSLEGSEVAAVLQAYLPLRALTPKLRLMEDLYGTSGSPSNDDWVSLRRPQYEMIGGMHTSYIPAIEAAIAELEKNLKN